MALSQIEFINFQKLIFAETGISLDENKFDFLQSRLYGRMLHYQLESFSDYFKIVTKDDEEKRQMINHITTNETSFFRETQHFDFFTSIVRQSSSLFSARNFQKPFRVWSAASSVGAEAYSLAMLLDDHLAQNQWQIIGTDINTEVIAKARQGLYAESWIDKIPPHYKSKYCLKGKGKYTGHFLIDRKLTQNTQFFVNNLLTCNKNYGSFDFIFLRNVFIYFNQQIKQKVLNNILENLNSGGYLIISLTENLDGLDCRGLKKCQSSIYQKTT